MANVEFYLALTGPNGRIKGNVEAQGYLEQIELKDLSWGAALKEVAADAGSDGAGSKRAEAGEVKLKKRFDPSSTALMKNAIEGTKLPKAVVTLVHRQRQQSWGVDAVKMTITLVGIRITQYVLNLVDADTEVTMEEDVDFSFDSIEIRYSGHKQLLASGQSKVPQANFGMKSDGGAL